MSDDIHERARKLFRPPFRFEGGYIWDARNEMVADNRPDEPADALMVLRQRGWGRMSHMEDTEALYQAAGAAVAEALTKGWAHLEDVPPAGMVGKGDLEFVKRILPTLGGSIAEELLKLRQVAEAAVRLSSGRGGMAELELAILNAGFLR